MVSNATNWRRYVREKLAPDIVGVDPTRDSPDYRELSSGHRDAQDELRRLFHGKQTVARDRMDVSTVDIVLANFLGASTVSIGSVGEIFWADANQKPVIIVREANGNPHDHDMINAIAAAIYTDLDDAVAKIKRMLSDGL